MADTSGTSTSTNVRTFTYADGRKKTTTTVSQISRLHDMADDELSFHDEYHRISDGTIVIVPGDPPDNRAPEADILTDTTLGDAPYDGFFDGGGSTDADGDAVTYAWFVNDQPVGNAETLDYTFTEPGGYIVKLVVTDPAGASDDATVGVTVNKLPDPNVDPVADFGVMINGMTITVDGNLSADTDGEITAWLWNFGDNVTWSGVTAQHTYAFAGDFNVTLTVVDDKGGSDSITKSVHIEAPNQAPTARFVAVPTNLVVSFDGRTSSDPDGTVASYAWNFGDGSIGSGAQTAHTYTTPGTYTVSLVVTDNKGATSPAVQQPVTVTAVLGQGIGFKLSPTSNKLLDKCGKVFRPVGTETIFATAADGGQWLPNEQVIWLKNYISAERVLFYYGNPLDPPPFSGARPVSPARQAQIVDLCIANGITPDWCISGGKDPNDYIKPEILAVTLPRQDKILIHLGGEGNNTETAQQWADRNKLGIAKLRQAGYTCPLYVLAPYGGRNLSVILAKGAEVLASDPLRNTIFGWQAYWGGSLDAPPVSGNFYQQQSNMTLRQAFDACAASAFMIQVGICPEAPAPGNSPIDWSAQLERCKTLGLAVLNWATANAGGGSLIISGWGDPETTPGVQWQPVYGRAIALSNANSLQKQQVKDSYVQTGVCS